MQFPISTRLRLLADVMKNPDLSDRDRRVYWLIAVDRSTDHGTCFCLDTYIAAQLRMSRRDAIRAKKRLVQAGLLKIEPGNKRTRQASFYSLLKKEGDKSVTYKRPDLSPDRPDQVTNLSPEKLIEIRSGTPEAFAWELDDRAHRRSPIVTRRGTARPSTWPPGHRFAEARQ